MRRTKRLSIGGPSSPNSHVTFGCLISSTASFAFSSVTTITSRRRPPVSSFSFFVCAIPFSALFFFAKLGYQLVALFFLLSSRLPVSSELETTTIGGFGVRFPESDRGQCARITGALCHSLHLCCQVSWVLGWFFS